MAADYAGDVAFLKKHTDVVELAGEGEDRLAVAPGFQGRVMTSTLAGGRGAAFGWLNEEFIASGRQDEHFNNYGGEDRFWLGPEGGQFCLWFKKGDEFDTDCWRTPAGFGCGAFQLTGQARSSVAMTRQFEVTNYSGTTFRCAVERTIDVIGRARAAALLGVAPAEAVRMVAFESKNALVNAGADAWRRETGLLSVWTLGQFKPLPRGKVIVPFKPGPEARCGPKATTDYFGEIPAERICVGDDHLLFTCDGKYRSKIGVSPARARNVLGSYDPDAKVLTIVQFTLPDDAAERPYVNSLWEIQDEPYAGDAINSYNDGPAKPGAEALGGFYELETSSPAAELKPEESITHVHRTFHFAGEFDALNGLTENTLGVNLTGW